jgi:DinB superfamily
MAARRAPKTAGRTSATARRARGLAAWRRDAARKMTSSRRETLTFVRHLPEADMREPRTIDDWSVKDVLGHLLACDDETADRFRLIARGRGDRIKWFDSLAYADRFNARTVARLRRVGLRTVLRRLARVRSDLVRAFRRLPVASLRDPSHAYPVVDWLPAPGWSHERDHLAEVRAWWSRRTRA